VYFFEELLADGICVDILPRSRRLIYVALLKSGTKVDKCSNVSAVKVRDVSFGIIEVRLQPANLCIRQFFKQIFIYASALHVLNLDPLLSSNSTNSFYS
jgi:hypothetical protein